MHQVIDTIRQIARHEVSQRPGLSLAVVKSVHGANGQKAYACTVELRDTGLVLPQTPIAANLIGSVALPREGDLVVVGFAEGDPHGPVVLGRLYSENVDPPQHGPGEVVTVLPGDETDSQKRLELRVQTPGDGSRSMRLTLDGSVKIELIVNDEGIHLQSQDVSLDLKQTGGGDGRATLKAGDATVTLEQKGEMKIEAANKITLNANEIEIAGAASVKISGATVDLN